MFQRFYNMGSIIQAIRMFLSNSYKNLINTIMLSYYFHSTNVMQGLNPDPNKKRIGIKQKTFDSFRSTSLGRSMERCRVRSQPLQIIERWQGSLCDAINIKKKSHIRLKIVREKIATNKMRGKNSEKKIATEKTAR